MSFIGKTQLEKLWPMAPTILVSLSFLYIESHLREIFKPTGSRIVNDW